jgi:(S)-3,5-dihydroxyphenylglycine transaminase
MSVSTPAAAVVLRREDLHASLSDPALDTMNFLNEVTARYPQAISFAPGRPYDGFFDVEEIIEHLRRYLTHLAAGGDGPEQIRDALFQYGPAAGRIRGLIAESLRRDEDIDVAPEAIVVTVGCQEAILLTLRGLIGGPDDVLLASTPCYVGLTGAARVLDIPMVTVPEGPDGFRGDELRAAALSERARGRRPRAFYMMPDHANPSGATMPLSARHELLDLAAGLGLLILEDSPYRLVSAGERLPTLKALDRRRTVVHLGSYSKTLFPGARVGFVVADQPVTDGRGRTGLLADELAKIKSLVTVNTSPLTQAVVGGMLLASDGRLSVRNARAAAFYGETLRATLDELAAVFPAERRKALGVRWNEPRGGFFIAVEVPFVADEAALTRSAQDFGVIWTPMSYFYPDGGGRRAIRLSTSYLSRRDIVEGIARLSRFIAAEAARVGEPVGTI